MGRWLHNLLTTLPEDTSDHPSIDELMQLGQRDALDKDTRLQLMAHVSQCPACLAMARQAAALADAGAGRRRPLWRRPVLALAASVILCVLTGSLVLHWPAPAPLTVNIAIDAPLRELLMQNSRLQWQDPQRIQRLAALLRGQGIEIASLSHVTLAEPYYAAKSLFGPPETLRLRIEKDRAWLEVVHELEEIRK